MKLSRRKYAVAVKALNELVASERVGVARRLKAIELLLGIYQRHDAAVERRERAKARKDAGLPPDPVGPVDHIPADTPEDRQAVEAAELRSAFDAVLAPKKAGVGE